jgi:hypothetical protein
MHMQFQPVEQKLTETSFRTYAYIVYQNVSYKTGNDVDWIQVAKDMVQ